MKRHPALVSLSREHHHGLVEGQLLRRGASADDSGRRQVAERFVAFFAVETVAHFREEEEIVFPTLLHGSEALPEPLERALLEHARIHELVDRLRRGLEDGEVAGGDLMATGTLLEAHIRLEERELFPLIERRLPEAELERLAARLGPSGQGRPALTEQRRGPVWGAASEDLNATLLAWDAGEGVPEHVEAERDVLIVVVAGSATIRIDGASHQREAGDAILIEKGRARQIVAGNAGVRYVSAHLRRPGLTLAPPPREPDPAS